MSNSNTNQRSLADFSLLSFDCFGTLVDQEGGVLSGLTPLLERLDSAHSMRADPSALVGLFSSHEARLQAEKPKTLQSTILAEAYGATARDLGLAEEDLPTEEERRAFGATMGDWPAFTDTVAALSRLGAQYKLVALTNTDEGTWSRIASGPLNGARLDAAYTAEAIGSFKPDLRNFEYLFAHVRDELGLPQEQILHVAQSLRHDHEPAAKMGLPSVWIDRYGKSGKMGGAWEEYKDRVTIRSTFSTLEELADAVDTAFAEAEGRQTSSDAAQ